jgi:hypothetical protein
MIEPETLAKRVEPLEPAYARMLRAHGTKITAYATPFLRRGEIYQVLYRGPYGPAVFTVGCVGPDFTVLLPLNPEGFWQLVARGGLVLDTTEKRTRYVVTFLETTRNFARRFQLLNRFDDIPKLPNPTPAEAERYQELRKKYAPVIHALELSGQPPWKGTAFALQRQDLVSIDVQLTPDGKVETTTNILEKDFPTTVAR